MSYQATDWIKHHGTFFPDKVGIIDLASNRRWTYGQYNDRVAQAAGYLKSKGVGVGDRVAFLALNTSDILDLIFGCWRLGATVVAINFRLAPGEVEFILNNSETSVILLDDTFKGMATALEGKTTIKHWISTDCSGQDNEWETGLKSADPIYEMHPQNLEDQCMLMYSSGTTGTPKGVIITHGMLYFSASSGLRPGGANIDGASLCNMPMFHIGGLNVTGLPAIWLGATVVIMKMFDPGKTLEAINDPELGINVLFQVPAAYNAMRAHPDVESTDFSRIDIACAGAETVPTELVHWWYAKGVIIQEGYGMTETAAAGCFLSKADIPTRIGSAGRSLIHTTLRIVDENGETCPANTPGEIWIKGACVTPGYWRRPEANENSFQDGWLKTGDVGRMDKDGYIYIEDRIKDMYISGGENVYPAEIENILYQMPEIAEVAVIGIPHEKWGEIGVACAVLKEGQSLKLEDLVGKCDGNLAKFKWPQHLHIMDVLPRTATGKVQKFELREKVPPLL